jgi:ADP-ribose pyrophosphatase
MRPDETRTAYEGSLIDVVVERWGERTREIVQFHTYPAAVTVVAVDREGCVVLVRQRREAARRALLELPAGGVEPGETPLEAARRELREETGTTGGAWRELTAFFTTPGFCREYMHLFVADGVDSGEADPDEDEELEIVRRPLDPLDTLLGELEDAKTIAGLLLYARERGV